MDYLPTIYSCGDAYYLGKVLDAVAAVCGTDGGLAGAAAVGALIGVIIITFQTIIHLKGINIHHLLVCWVIYVLSFGTTTDVAIQSAYSDATVIQKDNVPSGPAWIGVIVSNVGYHLTKKMEQAFGGTEGALVTNGDGSGFNEALYLINHVGEAGERGGVAYMMSKSPEGRALLTNLRNYTKDCTAKALFLGPEKGGLSHSDLLSKSITDAFEFNSRVYFTEVIPSGSNKAQMHDCATAWAMIKPQYETALNGVPTSVLRQFASGVGLCSMETDGHDTCTEISSPEDLNFQFQEKGLNAIQASQVKAQKFMLASVGRQIMQLGLKDGYAAYGDINSASMISQAIQQRNVQWAGEQSMFLNSVRPIMAFMESFFYAITPFAAVFVMLGLFGMGLFFKYILLLIWVQMWLPTMAVANMFIMSAATRQMTALGTGYLASQPNMNNADGSLSFYMYDGMIGIAKDWVATGAMFQAATPLLSLIIISGSVYALTSLTSRMAGADHINEKVVAPDVVSPAAAIGMQSAWTADAFKATLNGAKLPSINMWEILSNQKSFADEQSHQANRSLAHAINDRITEAGGYTNATAQIGSYLQSTSSSDVNSFGASIDRYKQFMSQQGQNVTTAQAITALTQKALSVSGGLDIGGGNTNSATSENSSSSSTSNRTYQSGSGNETSQTKTSHGMKNSSAMRKAVGADLGVKATGTASISNQDSTTTSNSNGQNKSDGNGFKLSDAEAAAINRTVAGSLLDQGTNSHSYSKNGTHDDALQNALSDARSQGEKSQQVDSYVQSLSLSRNLDLSDIASRVDSSEVASYFEQVKNWADQQYGEGAGQLLEAQANKLVKENQSGMSLGTNADTIGKLHALLTYDFGQNGMDKGDFNVRDGVLKMIDNNVALPTNTSGYQTGANAHEKVDFNAPLNDNGGNHLRQDVQDSLIKNNPGENVAQERYDLGQSKSKDFYDDNRGTLEDYGNSTMREQKFYENQNNGNNSLIQGEVWDEEKATGSKPWWDGLTGGFSKAINSYFYSDSVDLDGNLFFDKDLSKSGDLNKFMAGAGIKGDRVGFSYNVGDNEDLQKTKDALRDIFTPNLLKTSNAYVDGIPADTNILGSESLNFKNSLFIDQQAEKAEQRGFAYFKEQAKKTGYIDKNGNLQKTVDENGNFTAEGEKHANIYAHNMVNMARAAGRGNQAALTQLMHVTSGDGNGGIALSTFNEYQQYGSYNNTNNK